MTSGQVASIVFSDSARASSWTTGATPCAREDDGGALGHLVGLVDEDRAALLQRGHDVLVVHDLLAHVDRRAVELERLLDRDDGPVDARAVAARCRQEDLLRCAQSPHHRRRSTGPGPRGPFHAAHGGTGRPSVPPPTVTAVTSPAALPEKAADTTAEQPWPVRLLSLKIADYVDRMSAAVGRGPGRAAQPPPRRPHRLPDAARPRRRHVPVGVDRARQRRSTRWPRPLAEGARVVLQAKPAFWTKRGTLQLDARQIRPVGVGELLARLEHLKRHAGRRGPVRRATASGRCRSCPAGSAWSAAGPAPPSRTWSRTPGAAGRRCASRSARSPCRGHDAVTEVSAALRELDARPGGRRHRHRPRRRRRRGPAAVQQRDPGAGGRRGAHPRRQRHRPRRRHPAARPRRRRPGVHADRRRQAGRARRSPSERAAVAGTRDRLRRRASPRGVAPRAAAGWSSLRSRPVMADPGAIDRARRAGASTALTRARPPAGARPAAPGRDQIGAPARAGARAVPAVDPRARATRWCSTPTAGSSCDRGDVEVGRAAAGAGRPGRLRRAPGHLSPGVRPPAPPPARRPGPAPVVGCAGGSRRPPARARRGDRTSPTSPSCPTSRRGTS